MKTYRNDAYGFEMSVPDYWLCSSGNAKTELILKSKSRLFHANPNEFMSIEVVKLAAEQGLQDVKAAFEDQASQYGHIDIESDTIRAGNQEHFCTCYLLGKSQANKIAVGKEITEQIRHQYKSLFGGLTDSEFLDELYRPGRTLDGPVIKHYVLVFGQIEYDIKCALGCGTVSEVKAAFGDREQIYDDVVSSFRLLNPSVSAARQQAIQLTNEAFFLVEQRQYDLAVDLLQTAVQTDPTYGHAYNELAFIFGKMKGELDRAEEYIVQAVECEPENPKFLNTLSAIQAARLTQFRTRRQIRDNVNQRLPEIQRHIDDHPEYPSAHLLKAQMLALTGEPQPTWKAEINLAQQYYLKCGKSAAGLPISSKSVKVIIDHAEKECVKLSNYWDMIPE